MTPDEAKNVPIGAYRLKWRGSKMNCNSVDGISLVVVGHLYDGTPWFACANWTTKFSQGVIGSTDFENIESLTELAVAGLDPRVYTAAAAPTTSEELDAIAVERNKELDKVMDELDKIAKAAKTAIEDSQRRIRELICGS